MQRGAWNDPLEEDGLVTIMSAHKSAKKRGLLLAYQVKVLFLGGLTRASA